MIKEALSPVLALPETWVNPRDGSILRLIPSGRFIMGSSQENIELARRMDKDGSLFVLLHETPQFEATIPDFYLTLHAVTNEQFVRFLSETKPNPAQLSFWLPATERIIFPANPCETYRVEAGYERHPAVHVSWFGAQAYCQWARLRLPTEIEWEKAARGTDGRLFPWGNDWHDDYLRWYAGTRGENETTAPVDAYPEGRSPYGIFQMAGNVEEWCADWYQDNVYWRYLTRDFRVPETGGLRVVRGGTCLRRNRLEFRCAMRRGNDPALVNILYTGVRCACDADALR